MIFRRPRTQRASARRHARPAIEPLERREMLAGDLVISEILAINDAVLRDEDGEFPDWVEVHNPTTAAVKLDGWHLTDNADNLTKWEFPDVSLDAGGYLVVFASGKDRDTAGGELHTNFQLAGDGEFLALVEPDGETIAHQFAPEFPKQAEDISFGLGQEVTALLAAGAAAKTLIPTNGDLGDRWTAPDFTYADLGSTTYAVMTTQHGGTASVFSMQIDSMTVTDGVQIPEPSAFVLAALGLLGLLCGRRRRCEMPAGDSGKTIPFRQIRVRYWR